MSEAKQRTLNLTMSASAQSLPLDGRVLTPEMTAEALNTFRGPQGPKGDDGFIKFEELTDEQRELLRGPRGFDGPAGPEGPMGPTGPAGEPGKDAPQDAFTPSNPPTAEQVGALPANGTAANANQLNGKSADEYLLKTDTAADSAKLGGVAAAVYADFKNKKTYTVTVNSDFASGARIEAYSQAGYAWVSGWVRLKTGYAGNGQNANIATIEGLQLEIGTYGALIDRTGGKAFECGLNRSDAGCLVTMSGSTLTADAGLYLNFTLVGRLKE